MNYHTTPEFLKNVEVPQQTSSYKPVAHSIVIDTIEETLDKANIDILNKRFLSTNKGNQATFHYTLDLSDDKEQAIQIIAQNSYDKTLSFRLVSGSKIIICSNGMVISNTGDAFKKKHVGEIQTLTPAKIYEYIYNSQQYFDNYISKRELLKNYELKKDAVPELIGKLFLEKDILNTEQLNILKKEINNCSYNYNCDKNSAWQFYNNVTAALRSSHPSLWVENHVKFDKFINKELILN